MNAFSLGTIVILICLGASAAGLVLVRRHVNLSELKVNHEVGSIMISVLGTLYAIVLGLIVVDSLAHHELAEATESSEANAIGTVMHLACVLPDEQKKPILNAAVKYCDLAVDKEWPSMEKGIAPEPETKKAYYDLWTITAGYEPKTAKEQNIHQGFIAAMQQLSDSRRYRVVNCTQGIPLLLWMILICGGVSTIGFTYFFGAEKLSSQILMTSIVTFMLCLNVLLVGFYSRPYRGDLHIEPNSLIHVRESLRQAY
jgi:hypothetical protein